MDDDSEPKHVFRVEQHGEEPRFICADDMQVRESGIIAFHTQGPVIREMVAAIFPSPCLSVVRVDAMITQEGLKGT